MVGLVDAAVLVGLIVVVLGVALALAVDQLFGAAPATAVLLEALDETQLHDLLAVQTLDAALPVLVVILELL